MNVRIIGVGWKGGGYVAVPRLRGQQLKDYDRLDAWANDGSLEFVQNLCAFE